MVDNTTFFLRFLALFLAVPVSAAILVFGIQWAIDVTHDWFRKNRDYVGPIFTILAGLLICVASLIWLTTLT